MAVKVPPQHSSAVVPFAMAGTGEIRNLLNNESKLHANHKGPHQRPLVLVPLLHSVGTVRLVGEVSRGHAVVQGLLIAAKACIDARLALACEVLGVVGNVGVGICAWRASGLKPLREALRPGQGDGQWALLQYDPSLKPMLT